MLQPGPLLSLLHFLPMTTTPTIQWFPGHMHSTRGLIARRVKDIDVVIEVLDARIPGSSCNPLLHSLSAHRPRLKLLNKQDVADPQRTRLWLDWYNAQSHTRAIGMDANDPQAARRLVQACRELAPQRGGMQRPLRVMICGVPNVGKSTLINSMSRKAQARAADEAGVTRDEQRIVLADDFYLWDTPGMLWPRIAVPQSGFNLAASGSVGRNAYDEELVALELLAYLQRHYGAALLQRYRLALAADELAALPDDVLLEKIARQRGAVMAGGRLNMQKAAEIVLTDYRTHALGRITLETPEEFQRWSEAAAQADAQRQQQREQARQQRKHSATARRST